MLHDPTTRSWLRRALTFGGLCGVTLVVADAAESGARSSVSPPATGNALVDPLSVRQDPPSTAVVDTVAPVLVPQVHDAYQYSERIRFEQERMVREWMEAPLEPQTIYFPPAPPVLGATLSALGLSSDDIVQALAPYVAEPFYAPLSTRIAEEDLGRRLRARLEEYRADRAVLLAELRGEIEAMRHADASARRRALARLAEAQEPRLAGLEVAADELRREFFRSRFIGGGGDWNRYRSWHLDPATLAHGSREARLAELRVLRAAVFYQEGLSPAQRRLLRELTMELAAALHAPGSGTGLTPGDPAQVIFFSPDTARVPLPAGLPPDQMDAIRGYTADKDALKQELRHRIVALDRERNATRRVRALQDLAGEQTARLAELETRAEAIRERLARWPGAETPPTPSTLPGALEERVAAYLQAKGELQRIAQERLAGALNAFDREEKRRAMPRPAQRRAALVRTTVDGFHADHAARISTLNAEAEAIRGELVRLAPAPPDADASRPVDALLAEFAEAFKRQQLASLYAEYRTAVIEPGLSAAQRRLLFAGALAELKLTGAIRDQQVPPDEAFPQP